MEDVSTAPVAPSPDTSFTVPEQHALVEGNQRLLELQRLQEEQLKLTEQEIQEHQLKRELLLKKQQTERQLLLQQQQQQILHMRLKMDGKDEELKPTASNGVRVPKLLNTALGARGFLREEL